MKQVESGWLRKMKYQEEMGCHREKRGRMPGKGLTPRTMMEPKRAQALSMDH